MKDNKNVLKFNRKDVELPFHFLSGLCISVFHYNVQYREKRNFVMYTRTELGIGGEEHCRLHPPTGTLITGLAVF